MRIGAGHANLFAEPVRGTTDRSIDWYAPVDGDVTPYADLSTEKRIWFDQELARRRSELRALAHELTGQGREDDTKFGRILDWSLSYPGTDQLFLVGDQPVITFWGFEVPQVASPAGGPLPASALQEGEREDLGDRSRASDPTSEVTTSDPVRRTRGRWWMWPLLGLLALSLLLLLGRGCLRGCSAPIELGAVTVPQLRWPAVAPQDVPLREPTNGSGVEQVVAPGGSLGAGVAGTAGVGANGGSAENPGAANTSSNGTIAGAAGSRAEQDPARADEPTAGGGATDEPAAATGADQQPQGSDGDAPQAGVPEATPSQQGLPAAGNEDSPRAAAPPPASAPVSEDLQIPPVKDPPSFEFLRGRWQTTTDLYGGPENVPVAIEYDFDGSGRGKTTVRQSRGGACRSDTQAVFDPTGTLRIRDTSPPTCSDGSRYVPSEVRCSVGPDGKARCQGVQDNGNRFRAQMQRAAD